MSPKRISFSSNFRFMRRNTCDTAAQSFEPSKNAAIKLQNVKSIVKITLPPREPMTVSISTHEPIAFSWMNYKKFSYVLPVRIPEGTCEAFFFLRGLNLTFRGRDQEILSKETPLQGVCRPWQEDTSRLLLLTIWYMCWPLLTPSEMMAYIS